MNMSHIFTVQNENTQVKFVIKYKNFVPFFLRNKTIFLALWIRSQKWQRFLSKNGKMASPNIIYFQMRVSRLSCDLLKILKYHPAPAYLFLMSIYELAVC